MVSIQGETNVSKVTESSSDSQLESKHCSEDVALATTKKNTHTHHHLTRLISIPSFALTGTVVLVDINDPNFYSFTMSFK